MRYFIHSTCALLSLTLQHVFRSTHVDSLELDFESRTSQGNQSVQSGIEEILADLDAVKRAWKERYNAASMISRLPAEILSIVFQICARSAQLERGRRQQIEWTVVLQVCSHWRRIALESPSVWSYVTFAYLPWTEAMIERSKSAPLAVNVVVHRYCYYYAHGGWLLPDIVCSMLRKLSRRIRELSFTLWDGTSGAAFLDKGFSLFMSSLGESLDDDAGPSQLEDLTIHSVTQGSSEVPILPTTILHLGTSRLRNLRLHGVGRPWESPFLFKGLSLASLSITGIPINRGRPTVSQVIHVLERLPSLQFLCLDSIDFSSHLPDRVVYLNHLSHLELDCTLTGWSLLLSRLVYPPLMMMRLASKDDSMPSHKLDFLAGSSSVAHVLGQKLMTKLPIRCIVSRCSNRSVILQTWTKRGTRSGPPSLDPSLQLRISLTTWPTHKSLGNLLIRICGTLALGSLEVLHLEGMLVDADRLLESFGKLKSLNTIRIVRPGLHGLSVVEALSAGIVRDIGQQATAQPVTNCRLKFAALRNLVCEYWQESNPPWQSLADCLKERRRRGAGIRKLFLRSSWLSPQEFQSLKSKGVAQQTCTSKLRS